MRIFKKDIYPLRVYLEGREEDIIRIISSFQSKFYIERNPEYIRNDTDDLDNIVFKDGNEYYIPAGLINILLAEAENLNILYNNEVEESSIEEEDISIEEDVLDGIILRDYQIKGIEIALREKRGIMSLCTGSGKSELIIAITKYIIENKNTNILICVPTTNLLYQMYDRMTNRGIDICFISLYGGGNKLDTSCRIIISTVQSIYRNLDTSVFMKWYNQVECLMLDEAHHSAANTWYTVIDRISPKYILGFSAEPFYNDKEHLVRDLLLRGIIGPVLYRIPMQFLINKGFLSKPYVISLDSSYNGKLYDIINWHVVNTRGIVKNESRNTLIVLTAIELINMKKNPLILVQQISHGECLAKNISKEGYRVAIMTGGLNIHVYENGVLFSKFKDSEGNVKRDFQEGYYDSLIGTSVLDEGADIPSLSSVILAGGSKSKLKLIQRLGRGLRISDGKYTTIIIDFQDRFNVVLHSHYKKRCAIYKDNCIEVYHCNDSASLEKYVFYLEETRRKELSSKFS